MEGVSTNWMHTQAPVDAAFPRRRQRSGESARDVKWSAAGSAKYPL